MWTRARRRPGLCRPDGAEAYGGAGLGAVEMALVLEETGAHLAAVRSSKPPCSRAQAFCWPAAHAHAGRLLPRARGGRHQARFRLHRLPVDRPDLQYGALSGAADFVTFAHVADLLVIATEDQSLIALPRADSWPQHPKTAQP